MTEFSNNLKKYFLGDSQHGNTQIDKYFHLLLKFIGGVIIVMSNTLHASDYQNNITYYSFVRYQGSTSKWEMPPVIKQTKSLSIPSGRYRFQVVVIHDAKNLAYSEGVTAHLAVRGQFSAITGKGVVKRENLDSHNTCNSVGSEISSLSLWCSSSDSWKNVMQHDLLKPLYIMAAGINTSISDKKYREAIIRHAKASDSVLLAFLSGDIGHFSYAWNSGGIRHTLYRIHRLDTETLQSSATLKIVARFINPEKTFQETLLPNAIKAIQNLVGDVTPTNWGFLQAGYLSKADRLHQDFYYDFANWLKKELSSEEDLRSRYLSESKYNTAVFIQNEANNLLNKSKYAAQKIEQASQEISRLYNNAYNSYDYRNSEAEKRESSIIMEISKYISDSKFYLDKIIRINELIIVNLRNKELDHAQYNLIELGNNLKSIEYIRTAVSGKIDEAKILTDRAKSWVYIGKNIIMNNLHIYLPFIIVIFAVFFKKKPAHKISDTSSQTTQKHPDLSPEYLTDLKSTISGLQDATSSLKNKAHDFVSRAEQNELRKNFDIKISSVSNQLKIRLITLEAFFYTPSASQTLGIDQKSLQMAGNRLSEILFDSPEFIAKLKDVINTVIQQQPVTNEKTEPDTGTVESGEIKMNQEERNDESHFSSESAEHILRICQVLQQLNLVYSDKLNSIPHTEDVCKFLLSVITTALKENQSVLQYKKLDDVLKLMPYAKVQLIIPSEGDKTDLDEHRVQDFNFSRGEKDVVTTLVLPGLRCNRQVALKALIIERA